MTRYPLCTQHRSVNGTHFEGMPSANNTNNFLAAELVMAERRFIERREEAEVTVIDKTVRNMWSWKWTEKLVDGTILGECIRKLPQKCKLRESRLESHRAAESEGQAQRRKED